MLKVIAEDFIKTEAVEMVKPLYRQLVEATRKEPLCISYELYIDQKDSGHFIFVEEWPDKAALDVHCASEHFRHLVPQIDSYKRQEPRFILMDKIESNVWYRVTKSHVSDFPEPITLEKGSHLIIGEKYQGIENWDEWYFCETYGQKGGYVPSQIIQRTSINEGLALAEYTAKELNVQLGDRLIVNKILNGWAWCKTETGEKGWVPIENLAQFPDVSE